MLAASARNVNLLQHADDSFKSDRHVIFLGPSRKIQGHYADARLKRRRETSSSLGRPPSNMELHCATPTPASRETLTFSQRPSHRHCTSLRPSPTHRRRLHLSGCVTQKHLAKHFPLLHKPTKTTLPSYQPQALLINLQADFSDVPLSWHSFFGKTIFE